MGKFLLSIGSVLLACRDTNALSSYYEATAHTTTATTATTATTTTTPITSGRGVYKDDSTLPRRTADLYLAPSKIGGWGVYAARDFAEAEIVEIIPRFMVLRNTWFQQNVLDDYHYTFLWVGDASNDDYGVVVFGMGSFYNHAAENNVQFTHFGHEPTKDFPMYAPALGYTALRDIKRGEELLASYGDTDEWFTGRGLEMFPPAPPQEWSETELEERETMYCSKVVSGYGHPTWEQRVVPTQQNVNPDRMPNHDYVQRLPLRDHPTAVTKEFVGTEQLLEIAPALVVPLDQVQNSPFAPLGILWHDWDGEQKQTLEDLRVAGALRMKARKKDGVMSWDELEYYDDAVVLPVAGNLGLVRKVGPEADSNCRIEIVSAENSDIGSAGLVLKLISTKDIEAGEELKLNLPDNSSWFEKKSLLQNLAMTGQPIPPHLAFGDRWS